MSWTDDRVELLKKLWAEGLSASQIANQLGGVTRKCGNRQSASLGAFGAGYYIAYQISAATAEPEAGR